MKALPLAPRQSVNVESDPALGLFLVLAVVGVEEVESWVR